MDTLTFFVFGRLLDGGPAMGLVVNVLLSAVGMACGAVVGVPLGVLRAVTPPRLIAPVELVLGIIRGTPLLLLVLWTFLFIQVVLAVPLAPMWIGSAGLGLYAITHVSDIVRAGASALPRTQLRSAHALGLSHFQVARLVLIPYALRIMVPALTTFGTSVFKDSSVCYVIGVVNLVQLALMETTRRPTHLLEYYSLMAFLFLVFTLAGTRIAALVERKSRLPGALP